MRLAGAPGVRYKLTGLTVGTYSDAGTVVLALKSAYCFSGYSTHWIRSAGVLMDFFDRVNQYYLFSLSNPL